MKALTLLSSCCLSISVAGPTLLSAGRGGAQIPEGTRDPVTNRKAKPKCKVPVKGGGGGFLFCKTMRGICQNTLGGSGSPKAP